MHTLILLRNLRWDLLGIGRRTALMALPLLALIVMLNQGCVAVEKRKADIRGIITNISLREGSKTSGSMRVECAGKMDADTNVDKAMIRINEKTKLERLVGGEAKPAALSDFKEGDRVEAGFDGPVAESYPVQANGGWVLLLGKN